MSNYNYQLRQKLTNRGNNLETSRYSTLKNEKESREGHFKSLFSLHPSFYT